MLYIIKDFYIVIFILNGTKEHCNIIIIICKKKKLQINIKMNIISVSYLKKYIRIAIHTKKYEKNNII